MRLNGVRNALFVTMLVTVVGAGIYAQGQAAPQTRTPQNLQVLPKDLTLQQVQQTMRGFVAALGVECTHCHVGGMQDRAKDDNPKKAIARKMLQMQMALNKDLASVGEPAAAGAMKVTCFTCHRGALKPLTAPPPGGGN
jgi:hypothetical protein